MKCSICGISDSKRRVFQAVSPKGIILVCDKCALEEGFPILKKPRIEQEKTKETVYERMTRLSGVKPREPKKPELKKQEKSLKEIINKNYEEKLKIEALILKPRPDLVENFHWIIMRVRRVKGLTQKELAERIGESEAAIKMAEQGVVPEGYKLLEKLERFLRVRLIKEKTRPSDVELKQKDLTIPRQPPQQLSPSKVLKFDKQSSDSLTIADLKRMKTERELAKKEKYYETAEEVNEKDEI